MKIKTQLTGWMYDGHLSFSDTSGRMSGVHPTSVPLSDFFWMLMYGLKLFLKLFLMYILFKKQNLIRKNFIFYFNF